MKPCVNIKESKKIAKLAGLFETTLVYPYYDKKLFNIMKTVSFKVLIELNLRFLTNNMPRIWYYLAPLNDETIPLLDNLRRLNSAGFLSYEGQPYMDSVYQTIKIKQRPYIKGYMEKINQKFLDYLRRKDIIVFYEIPNKPTLSNFKHEMRAHIVTKEKPKNEHWKSRTCIYPTLRNQSYLEIDILKDLVNVNIFTRYWKNVDLINIVYDAMNHANL